MRTVGLALLTLILIGCGPKIDKTMPEAAARSTLVSFLSNGARGCTDDAVVELRSALASYSAHMQAADRPWPYPHSFKRAPQIGERKIEKRTIDDTDTIALLAVREGMANMSDFSPLAQDMMGLTWTYHTPKIDRQPFGTYAPAVRAASCKAFVEASRARFELERRMAARAADGRGDNSAIGRSANTLTSAECHLSQAIVAAGGKAPRCADRDAIRSFERMGEERR